MSQALGAKANQYIADAMQCLGSVPESYTHALCDAAMAIADHLVQDKKVLIVGLDDCGGLTDYCVNAFYSPQRKQPASITLHWVSLTKAVATIHSMQKYDTSSRLRKTTICF